MVTAQKPNKLPLLVIDALGATLAGGLVIGCIYLTFVHGEHATREIQEFTQLINSASQDLASIQSARDQQGTVLRERRAEISSGRQLPTEIPLEEYFQVLSRLASQHSLRVLRQNPLSPREYPGLLEHRYAYEVTGSMPDIARFFKAVEEADFWADIAYLKITNAAQTSATADSQERVALLTISLFSASRPEGAPNDG